MLTITDAYNQDILQSDAWFLINTVNCVGVMGKGLALQYKRKYPEMFRTYRTYCKQGKLRPGGLHLYEVEDHIIVNLPTKDHWRNPSTYEYVVQGLAALVKYLHGWGSASVAIPALGCRNGGLDWNKVYFLIKAAMEYLPADEEDYDISIHHPWKKR